MNQLVLELMASVSGILLFLLLAGTLSSMPFFHNDQPDYKKPIRILLIGLSGIVIVVTFIWILAKIIFFLSQNL